MRYTEKEATWLMQYSGLESLSRSNHEETADKFQMRNVLLKRGGGVK